MQSENVTQIGAKSKSKDAIVVKYSEFSQQTLMSVNDLYRNKSLPLSAAMTTKKLFNQLQKAQQKITSEYMKEVAEKYQDKDAPKDAHPDPLYGFVVKKGTEEDLKKDHEAFGEKTISFEGFNKFKLSSLEKANLSAQDLEALEMFIDEKL